MPCICMARCALDKTRSRRNTRVCARVRVRACACVHDRLAGCKKIEFKATVNLHADQVGGLPKRDKNKILPGGG